MAINAAARAKLVCRLLEETEKIKQWIASENLMLDDPLRSLELALTVTDGNKKKTVIKHKKTKGQPKPISNVIQDADWDAITKAVQFSSAEAPWDIVQFFKGRGNTLASQEELRELPYLKKINGRFSQVETQWLNSLLKRACTPYRLRSAGRGTKAYQFFIVEIVEMKEAPLKSDERQLKLFEDS
ncbi:MAG: hypothetical protein Q7R63_01105 [bacterium]|nr:hypothetical protein [bacterium]